MAMPVEAGRSVGVDELEAGIRANADGNQPFETTLATSDRIIAGYRWNLPGAVGGFSGVDRQRL